MSEHPEQQSKRGRRRLIQRHVRMRRNAGKKSPGAAVLKLSLKEFLRRLNGTNTELDPGKRMPWQMYGRSQNLRQQLLSVSGQWRKKFLVRVLVYAERRSCLRDGH